MTGAMRVRRLDGCFRPRLRLQQVLGALRRAPRRGVLQVLRLTERQPRAAPAPPSPSGGGETIEVANVISLNERARSSPSPIGRSGRAARMVEKCSGIGLVAE